MGDRQGLGVQSQHPAHPLGRDLQTPGGCQVLADAQSLWQVQAAPLRVSLEQEPLAGQVH